MKNRSIESKRIGIITFHCSYNYGSALQAFALQEFIRKLGYKASIIDFRYSIDFQQYLLFRRHDLFHIKSLIRDILFLPSNIKRKINFQNFWKHYFILTNKQYNEDDDLKDLNNKYDGFICGSDQIWNIDCTLKIIPQYFLSFADCDKLKIAYGPSVAHTSFSVGDFDRNNYRELLNGLDRISIRERSTLPLIKSLTSKNVEVVLDPTLLFDGDFYRLKLNLKSEIKDFIFVYILEKNDEILDYAVSLSKKKKLRVYYLSSSRRSRIVGAKNVYGISPVDFLKYINSAKYVVTNSFHATVFSILFNKQFVTFRTQNSSSRMVDLLNELDLSSRLYNKEIDIDAPYDVNELQKKLSKLRESSVKYLKDSLQIKK